jgi:hypothetical protein
MQFLRFVVISLILFIKKAVHQVRGFSIAKENGSQMILP